MEALRARILTKSCWNFQKGMPASQKTVNTLATSVDALTESVDSLTERVDVLAERVDALTAEVRAFIEATNRRLDNIDSRLDRMEGDNASLQGFGAEYRAGIEIVNIVEHVARHGREPWAGMRSSHSSALPTYKASLERTCLAIAQQTSSLRRPTRTARPAMWSWKFHSRERQGHHTRHTLSRTLVALHRHYAHPVIAGFPH